VSQDYWWEKQVGHAEENSCQLGRDNGDLSRHQRMDGTSEKGKQSDIGVSQTVEDHPYTGGGENFVLNEGI